jgi:hypothetical protein
MLLVSASITGVELHSAGNNDNDSLILQQQKTTENQIQAVNNLA